MAEPARPGVRHLEVTGAEAGQKLIRFLERRLPGVPGSALMRVIRTGQVRVEGARRKPFDRVEAGQLVRVPPLSPAPEAANKEPAPGPACGLTVLHAGPDAAAPELVVINKPAGLAVHPGTGHADCVVLRLRAMFPEAAFAPTPAHRLDRDTSGVLACALSYSCLRRLQEAFRQGRAAKTYLAWVHGTMTPGQVLDLSDRLAKTGPPGRERVRPVSVGGKAALARARSLAVRETAQGNMSLVLVRLYTGRKHQIRVQMACQGHPVAGDAKYGPPLKGPQDKTGPAGQGGMRLHAWRLALPEGVFTAPPPWDGPFAAPGDLLALENEP